jgi:hypothetical protein
MFASWKSETASQELSARQTETSPKASTQTECAPHYAFRVGRLLGFKRETEEKEAMSRAKGNHDLLEYINLLLGTLDIIDAPACLEPLARRSSKSDVPCDLSA